MRLSPGPAPRPSMPYLFVAPAVAVLGLLTVYPVFFGGWASLHSWNWLAGQAEHWVFNGLANYAELLRDAYFWNSVGRTLVFTLGALVVQFGLGFGVALLLNREIRGAWFFRSAVIFPLMVSDIVAALMWRMLLDPSLGPLNYYLGRLGLPTPNWLGSPEMVIPALVLVDTWWQTGNITLILLAGLQSLPAERLEMARVDGAAGWRMLRDIVVPGIRRFILVAVTFRTIDLLRVFAIAWGITAGGPNRASEVTQLYIYAQGVGRLLRMGYASALSIVFAVLVALVAGLYILLMRREDVAGE